MTLFFVDGRLRPGDHILKIRGITVHGMSSQQVATILRQQDAVVELVVGRPAAAPDECSSDAPSKFPAVL
ncbi:unnamed protein product [Gongylonema pulchrum]|uniref:PDZ domain-containing protein n=1 Tax=Gongylonema pulchrum TaxID=637853 RepID=A0A183CXS1_9BILA|nr:unnamed protein product [Gongylonema pulchrum]